MKSSVLTLFCSITLGLFAALALPNDLAAQQPRYKLVYLDELGGPNLTVGGDISCCGILPSIINNSGIAVGAAQTPTPNPTLAITNPLIPPNAFVNPAVAWQNPTPFNLGTLPGGYNSFAGAISNSGLIVGNSETGDIDPRSGVVQVHPALWVFGHAIDLGSFGGDEGSANQVNDFGLVVGFAQNDVADSFDYFGFGTQSRAFLWQFGVLKELGTLGGTDSQAVFVNDRGQIAGFSFTTSTAVTNTGFVCAQTNIPPQDPFFWDNGKMLDIGNLGGNCAAPAGLNNKGQVAGNSDLADVTVFPHAFLWSRQTGMKDLGTLGGTFAQADALTDSGEVVGTSSTQGDQAFLAVLWKDGVITNLGTLPGDCDSSAYAINSKGQIIGDSYDCDTFSPRPFLWENGHMYGFNIVPPAGTQLMLSEPASINDQGEIVGFSLLDTGYQAFLLVPCGHIETQNCENVTTDASAATQSNPKTAVQSPATADQRSLTRRKILALTRRWLGRS
jgi:probable HAF family extracellular repeat protein